MGDDGDPDAELAMARDALADARILDAGDGTPPVDLAVLIDDVDVFLSWTVALAVARSDLYVAVPLSKRCDESIDRLVDECWCDPPLPVVNITSVDLLHAPRGDAALLRCSSFEPRIGPDIDQVVDPRSRREREADVLLSVERSPRVV